MNLETAPETEGEPPPQEHRSSAAKLFLARLLLWAGPVGLGLALVVLVASGAAGYFRSGPGVPTAGDTRAWNAMWGALGLVAVGTVFGVLANVGWVFERMHTSKRPSIADWIRLGIHASMAGLLWWALGSM